VPQNFAYSPCDGLGLANGTIGGRGLEGRGKVNVGPQSRTPCIAASCSAAQSRRPLRDRVGGVWSTVTAVEVKEVDNRRRWPNAIVTVNTSRTRTVLGLGGRDGDRRLYNAAVPTERQD